MEKRPRAIHPERAALGADKGRIVRARVGGGSPAASADVISKRLRRQLLGEAGHLLPALSAAHARSSGPARQSGPFSAQLAITSGGRRCPAAAGPAAAAAAAAAPTGGAASPAGGRAGGSCAAERGGEAREGEIRALRAQRRPGRRSMSTWAASISKARAQHGVSAGVLTGGPGGEPA